MAVAAVAVKAAAAASARQMVTWVKPTWRKKAFAASSGKTTSRRVCGRRRRNPWIFATCMEAAIKSAFDPFNNAGESKMASLSQAGRKCECPYRPRVGQ